MPHIAIMSTEHMHQWAHCCNSPRPNRSVLVPLPLVQRLPCPHAPPPLTSKMSVSETMFLWCSALWIVYSRTAWRT